MKFDDRAKNCVWMKGSNYFSYLKESCMDEGEEWIEFFSLKGKERERESDCFLCDLLLHEWDFGSECAKKCPLLSSVSLLCRYIVVISITVPLTSSLLIFEAEQFYTDSIHMRSRCYALRTFHGQMIHWTVLKTFSRELEEDWRTGIGTKKIFLRIGYLYNESRWNQDFPFLAFQVRLGQKTCIKVARGKGGERKLDDLRWEGKDLWPARGQSLTISLSLSPSLFTLLFSIHRLSIRAQPSQRDTRD